jgi:hypothetical protein
MAKRAVMIDIEGVEWRYENYDQSMRNPQSPNAFMVYNTAGRRERLADVLSMYGLGNVDKPYLLSRYEDSDG